jgi:hypothetical protein
MRTLKEMKDMRDMREKMTLREIRVNGPCYLDFDSVSSIYIPPPIDHI